MVWRRQWCPLHHDAPQQLVLLRQWHQPLWARCSCRGAPGGVGRRRSASRRQLPGTVPGERRGRGRGLGRQQHVDGKLPRSDGGFGLWEAVCRPLYDCIAAAAALPLLVGPRLLHRTTVPVVLRLRPHRRLPEVPGAPCQLHLTQSAGVLPGGRTVAEPCKLPEATYATPILSNCLIYICIQ